MSDTATLKIWRGQSKAQGKDQGRWESHAVPFERGQSVLDGLRWIRAHKDPSLAIRFSCINANACKECMMELDGETVYACTARLEPRRLRPRHCRRERRRAGGCACWGGGAAPGLRCEAALPARLR